jgi:hypothetical protein
MTVNANMIVAAVSAVGGSFAFAAIARHIPDWPLSCAKLWGWFKDSTQEIASQKRQNP